MASGTFRQDVPESPLIPAYRRTTAQIGRCDYELKIPANHAFARCEVDLVFSFVVQAVAGSNPVVHTRMTRRLRRGPTPRRSAQYSPPFAPRAEEEQMSETIDSARRLIADRLREVEVEAALLEGALKGMAQGDGSRPAVKPRRKRAPGKRRRSQAPRGRRREELLGAIEAKPGSRPAELAAEIGVSASQVHGLIAKARAEKLIVKKGAGYALKG